MYSSHTNKGLADMSSKSTLSANNQKLDGSMQFSGEDLDVSEFSENSSNTSSIYTGDEISSSDSMMNLDDIERHDSIFIDSDGEGYDEASVVSIAPTCEEISAINIGRKSQRLGIDEMHGINNIKDEKASLNDKKGGAENLSRVVKESGNDNETEKGFNTTTKRNSLSHFATTTRKSLTGNLNLTNFAITNRYSTGMRFFDNSNISKDQSKTVPNFPPKLNADSLNILEMAVNLFNLKPHRGIDHLIKNNIILPNAEGIVWFLKIRKDDLSKRKLGEFLCGPDPDIKPTNISHRF